MKATNCNSSKATPNKFQSTNLNSKRKYENQHAKLKQETLQSRAETHLVFVTFVSTNILCSRENSSLSLHL